MIQLLPVCLCSRLLPLSLTLAFFCCLCSAVGGGTAFGVIFAVGSLVRQ